MELAEQVKKFAEDIEHYEYNDDLSFHLFKDKFRSIVNPLNRDYVKYVKAYYCLFVLNNIDKRVHKGLFTDDEYYITTKKDEPIGTCIIDTDNYIFYSPFNISFHGENVFDKDYLNLCIITSTIEYLPLNNSNVVFNTVMDMDDIEVLQELLIEEGTPDLSKYSPLKGIIDRINLLNLAQMHGAVKCFKWLFLNGYYDSANQNEESIIYGGNYEIFHIMERETTMDYYKLIDWSIILHKHELFDYLINRAEEENIHSHFITTLLHYNYYASYRMIEIFEEIKLSNNPILRHDLKISHLYQYIKDSTSFKDETNIIIKNHKDFV